jgi:hypothetical protein
MYSTQGKCFSGFQRHSCSRVGEDFAFGRPLRHLSERSGVRCALREAWLTSRQVADKTCKVIDYLCLGPAQACIPEWTRRLLIRNLRYKPKFSVPPGFVARRNFRTQTKLIPKLGSLILFLVHAMIIS